MQQNFLIKGKGLSLTHLTFSLVALQDLKFY